MLNGVFEGADVVVCAGVQGWLG